MGNVCYIVLLRIKINVLVIQTQAIVRENSHSLAYFLNAHNETIPVSYVAGTQNLRYHLLPPRLHIIRNLELRWEPGLEPKFPEMQAPQITS